MNDQFSVESQIAELLGNYSRELKEVCEKATKTVSKETAQTLKNTSPKGRTGDYARGWTYKKQSNGDYIVHNKTRYRLTHLLEFGHVVRNAKGVYGRAPSHPHIEPAADEGVTKFENEIIKGANSIDI